MIKKKKQNLKVATKGFVLGTWANEVVLTQGRKTLGGARLRVEISRLALHFEGQMPTKLKCLPWKTTQDISSAWSCHTGRWVNRSAVQK